MSKKKGMIEIPAHFVDHLGKVRQWIDGFEQAGKKGPANADTLRQIQIWLGDLKRSVK